MTNKISKKKNGSILWFSLIFTIAFGLTIGAILKFGLLESKLSERGYQSSISQNVVESVLDANIAKLASLWQNTSIFPSGSVSGLVGISSTVQSSFPGNNISFSNSSVTAGAVSSASTIYIDPTDPSNTEDPAKGKNIVARNVTLLAKVQATGQLGTQETSYGKAILQIRNTPLLSYAVFYAMDMEFHPGPNMTITGPIHTNGDIYYSPGGQLYFNSSITTSGNIYHTMAPGSPESDQGGTVWISNGSSYVNDYKGSGSRTSESSYYDSNYSDWKTISSSLWNGNVQSSVNGIQPMSLVNFPNYVRDNPATSTVDDALNYAYAVIEPNLLVAGRLNSTYNKGAGEQQKFAYQAGLTARIYKGTSKPVSNAVRLSTNYWVAFFKLSRTDAANPFSSPVLNGNNQVTEVPITVKSSYVSSLMQMNEYKENSSGTPTSGFYDLRMNQGLNILQLDISQLRLSVDNTASGYSTSMWQANYSPTQDYNGVIYVEFPWNTAQTPGPDNVMVGNSGYGLFVKNGTSVPNPSYNNAAGRQDGFTLATNNVMYIKGSFNADGNASTGSSTTSDNASNPNPPAFLAADAITVLSNNWNFSLSKNANVSNRPATFTEITAAFLQGIVPTGKGGTTSESGGVHNFPRLLENWSNVELRIRGSLNCLYESEIANQFFGGGYYSPPIRNWGYFDQFGNGNYPPGMPSTRSFRKIAFSLLTLPQYTAALSSL